MSKIVEIEKFLSREIALILRMNEAEVNMDTSFDSFGIDSMAFVEVLIAIENKFGVNLIEAGVTKDDLKSLRTLAQRIEKEL